MGTTMPALANIPPPNGSPNCGMAFRTALSDVTAPQLLAIAKHIESRGALDIAKRSLQICWQILLFALAHGVIEPNSSAELKPPHALRPRCKENYARLEVKEVSDTGKADLWPGYQGMLIRTSGEGLGGRFGARPGSAGLFGLLPHLATDLKICRSTFSACSETGGQQAQFLRRLEQGAALHHSGAGYLRARLAQRQGDRHLASSAATVGRWALPACGRRGSNPRAKGC